jgi:hypothetical protein
VKLNPGTAEKISIEKIEPLLKSILDSQGLTEEQLCIKLEYNEGYISQLRSREKKFGKPQISPKFYKKLQLYSLQNASDVTSEFGPNIADDPVAYKNESAFSKGKDAFNALLAEKEKAEERALKAEKLTKKMESHYNDAIKDKSKLFDIFSNSLKEISGILSDVTANLNQINQHLAQLKDHPLPLVKKSKASAGRQQNGKKKDKG